jgi:hypothetical protein
MNEEFEIKLSERLKQLGYIPQTAAIAYNILVKSIKDKETILYLLEGAIRSTLGFIVATDQRCYYVGIDKYQKPFIESLDYDQIFRITIVESFFPTAEINVITNSALKEIHIKGCDPKSAKEFVELILLLNPNTNK